MKKIKQVLKKILIIHLVVLTLLPSLFSGFAYAANEEETTYINTERAGNYAANFAINFYENWSSEGYVQTSAGTSSSTSSSSAASTKFSWPLTDTNTYISSPFGATEDIRSSAHNGLDIAPLGDTGRGIDVYATANGTILAADTGNVEGDKSANGGMGNYVTLVCGDITVRVMHLQEVDSSIINSIGQSITAGTYLGKMGNTGSSTGKHLHIDFSVQSEEIAKEYTENGTLRKIFLLW